MRGVRQNEQVHDNGGLSGGQCAELILILRKQRHSFLTSKVQEQLEQLCGDLMSSGQYWRETQVKACQHEVCFVLEERGEVELR